MKDLISRQALCEYALNQKDKSITPNDIMRFPSAQPETCAYWDRESNFCALNRPSAQPEQRWTPCSERKPKGQEIVNVSCHDDSGDTSYDYSSCGWVTDDGEYWIVDNEINHFVVAWMPLPEPYKGGQNDIPNKTR